MIFQCDGLCLDDFFGSDGKKCVCFDGGVVGDDYLGLFVDLFDVGDGVVVGVVVYVFVYVVVGEGYQFVERGVGVDEFVYVFVGGQVVFVVLVLLCFGFVFGMYLLLVGVQVCEFFLLDGVG